MGRKLLNLYRMLYLSGPIKVIVFDLESFSTTTGVKRAMLIAMLRAHIYYKNSFDTNASQEHNLGVLLVTFFDMYGRKLNTSDVGISCNEGSTFFSKKSKGFLNAQRRSLISIQDPQDPQNDIGKNSFNYFQIKLAFGMACSTLTNAKLIMSLGPTRSILGTIIRPDKVVLERKAGLNGDVTFSNLIPGAGDPLEKDYKEHEGLFKQSNAGRLSRSAQDSKEETGMESLSISAIERLQLHMQLQNLENPDISQSTNLELWPCKLNPIQEKMMHSLQLLNQSSNPRLMQHVLPNAPPKVERYNRLEQIYSLPSKMLMNQMKNSNNGIDIPEASTHVAESDGMKQTSMEFQQYWALKAEIDQFLSNKGANAIPLDQEQTSEFDCLKELI